MSGDAWNILLVDDEEEFVSTLADRLDIRGINSRVALNGETALEMLADFLPDVVVLDMNMPGLTGLEVLQAIRASYPLVPVIMLTGQAEGRERDMAMSFGAFGFLVKPVSLDDFMAKVEKAVEAVRAQPRKKRHE